MREGQSEPGEPKPGMDEVAKAFQSTQIQDLTLKLQDFTNRVIPEAGNLVEQLKIMLTAEEFCIVRLFVQQLKMASAPTEADLQSKLKGMKHAETKEAAGLDPQMLEEQKPQDILKVIQWACEENAEIARGLLCPGPSLDSLHKPVKRRPREKAPCRHHKKKPAVRSHSLHRRQLEWESMMIAANPAFRADFVGE
eukprot:symbB.v1.2.027927.t1/scaffold2902.1/size67635/1